MTKPAGPEAIAGWLDQVASGALTMSQRRVAWAEANGGIEALVAAARARGLHLVQLTDDEGHALIAASREPFTTLC